MCYNDICRAAFHIPPTAGDSVLRSIAPELAEELKVRGKNISLTTLTSAIVRLG